MGGSVAVRDVAGMDAPEAVREVESARWEAVEGSLRLVCAESGPAYEAVPTGGVDAGVRTEDPHARLGLDGRDNLTVLPAPDVSPNADGPLDENGPLENDVPAETGVLPDPYADVLPDSDALDDLSDEIVTLAAHIHAGTHQLLVLIARFDRGRGWEVGGHRSCAHWLAFRTGIALGAAREKVRAAHAMEQLPRVSASMARGELSFSKVRALTRVATAENETELLEFARSTTTEGLERLVRGWKKLSRLDEQELEGERHRSRCFSVFPDDDGMYVVRGRLDPEVGALLMRAIEAAGDALFVKEHRETAALRTALGMDEPPKLRTTPKQRRADAVGLLAERALAVGFGGAGGGESGVDGDGAGTPDGEAADVGGDGDAGRGRAGEDGRSHHDEAGRGEADDARPRKTATAPPPLSGTRAERYQVVLFVDPETLAASGEPGRSELEDGTHVAAETSRRLACDTAVITLVQRKHGRLQGKDDAAQGKDGAVRARGGLAQGRDNAILDVGRKSRTIPPAIRRALEARDRGCRFPGLRIALHRRPSREALGRRGRDPARKPRASVPPPSPRGARGGLPGGTRPRRAAQLFHTTGDAAAGGAAGGSDRGGSRGGADPQEPPPGAPACLRHGRRPLREGG